MSFLALLTKELRLRMRRERTIWVVVLYILLMGLIAWFYVGRFANFNGSGNMTLNDIGTYLYMLLSMVQLFLIVFITPAFTATAVNGEKERQTFDLILCARISAFSLIAGKLVAGLVNSLLLIAASVPLFSLVFFFGGISPQQILSALLVVVSTTLIIGTFGLFCSTLLPRPAISTAIAYTMSMLWVLMPLVAAIMLSSSGNWLQFISPVGVLQSPSIFNRPSPLFVWNPIIALMSTFPSGSAMSSYALRGLKLSPWLAYTLLNLLATAIFFLLSVYLVKPVQPGSLWRKRMLVENSSSADVSGI
jgi:ABC-type transport system involved in multi-copper enzyme maturation permease subunit